MPRAIRKATPTFEAAPMLMALVAAIGFLVYAGCDTTPKLPKPRAAALSPTWYEDAVKELTDTARAAQASFSAGKGDEASALVQKGEKLATKVMSVPRPTLAATEAASDIDHLYGQMLASNHKYGWARLQFQKNLSRWKYWKPATDESARRLRQAQAAIADCDKHID
jgi:hypothetical protein